MDKLLLLIQWIRRLRRQRQPLTELRVEWGDLKIRVRSLNPNASQSEPVKPEINYWKRSTFPIHNESNQTEYGLEEKCSWSCEFKWILMRKKNTEWMQRSLMDLQRKRLWETEKALALKHILQEYYLSNPRRDGLTQGQMERLEGNWQDEWPTEKMTGTHTLIQIWRDRKAESRHRRR